MIVKLLTEHHLEFISLKGGCRGSSESTHVKMPHCLKSHALAHFKIFNYVSCTNYTSGEIFEIKDISLSCQLKSIVENLTDG